MKREVKQNIIIFLVPLAIFLCFFFAYYPGLMTVDGNNQWWQVSNQVIMNDHPFFSTYFIYLLTKIWNDPKVLIIFQIIIFSLFWMIMCAKIRTKDNFKRQIIYTICLSLIPIISLYSITVWKDILYSYYLIALSFMTYDLSYNQKFNGSKFTYVWIGILLFLVFSYRHNGIIVAIFYIFFIVFLLFKKNKNELKKVLLTLLLFSFLLIIISFPKRYYLEKIKKNNHEATISTIDSYVTWMFGSYVKAGVIEDDDLSFLDNVISISRWSQYYDGYVINSTFLPGDVNKEYIISNNKKYHRLFIKYVIKRPDILIKHYMKADSLLFSINSTNDGYVYVFPFSDYNYLSFDDLIDSKLPFLEKFYTKIVNLSFMSIFKLFYQPGLILYLCVVLAIYMSNKFKNIYLILVPMFLNTGSLIFINLAQDLRYVYINYLTLAVLGLIYFSRSRDGVMELSNKENKKKITNKDRVLIIIPAYNEAENIDKVLDEIERDASFADIVVINDCSTDNTREVVLKHKNVTCIDGVFNLKYAGAVQTGLKYAYQNDYDYVIQFDADGQHIAKEAIRLLEESKKTSADIVIGSRYLKDMGYPCPFFRRIGTKIFEKLINLFCHQRIADPLSGFQCLNKRVIARYAKMGGYPEFPDANLITEMLLNGYKVVEIPVKMRLREAGESMHGGIIKPIKYMINMFYTIFFILIQNISFKKVRK